MRRQRVAAYLGLLALAAFAAGRLEAAGEPEETVPARPKPATYADPYKNPLYSTLVAFLSGAPDVEGEQGFQVKVEGLKEKLDVKAVLQKQPAPLVVVLVGGDGKSSWPLGRLFPYILAKYLHVNVMYFDATFRPTYMVKARSGVTGNFRGEAEEVGKLIDAFVKLPEVKPLVSEVGVLGYSMGATQALLLARLAEDGKLPFELKGALAFSPPVRLRATARILDGYYKMDRFKYTRVEMALAIMNHEPVKPGEAIPFEDDFMRAGIGTVIRDEFTEIVDRNDKTFRLRKIPFEEDLKPGQNREEIARSWGFEKFMDEMCFPYWQKKGAFKTLDEMWEAGDMTKVMAKLPAYARAVICEDDPFNEPQDLAALKQAANPKNLVLLPSGGHIGYFGSEWCFRQLESMFDQR
ncbi:MAG: alpha/beta fold hydrolase [Planctomycetota bacterium]|nr:alpha/beta fold hydrolase [Planctomycetota bacterium]